MKIKKRKKEMLKNIKKNIKNLKKKNQNHKILFLKKLFKNLLIIVKIMLMMKIFQKKLKNKK